ncbi:hypothetical protein D3C80_1971980 [compost metagenome]
MPKGSGQPAQVLLNPQLLRTQRGRLSTDSGEDIAGQRLPVSAVRQHPRRLKRHRLGLLEQRQLAVQRGDIQRHRAQQATLHRKVPGNG